MPSHTSRFARFLLLKAVLILFPVIAAAQKHDHKHQAGDTMSVHQFMSHVKLKHKKPVKHSLSKGPKTPPPTTSTIKSQTGTTTAPSGTANSPMPKKVLNPSYSVFGWHPYWMENAYEEYDFKLLSHVAYFSYEVDPSTGKAKSYHDWLTTGLIDSAKAQNPECKVLLTLSCFGSDTKTFLKNSAAQSTLVTTVISLLDQRKADGVNVDFEGIPAGLTNDFSIFIGKLAIALHEKNYIMTLAIPAIDRNGIYDIETLNTYTDLYVLMGYGFYGSFSSKPGPVSPLLSSDQWGTASIAQSVQYYLGQDLPREKLLIGLPYYGAFWQTQPSSSGADSLTFLEYLTYTSYMEQVGADGQLDSLSVCCFSDQQKDDILNHYWGEDTSSLSGKFDWVLMNQLKGIGIWALGYDNGREELWTLIGDKFGTDSATVISGTADDPAIPPDSTHTAGGNEGGDKDDDLSMFQKALQFYNTYTYSILFAFLVLFICIIAGYLSLYLKEETAAMLKEKKIYYPGLIVSAILLNLIAGISIYLTYGIPPVIIIFFSLLFWTIIVLTYYFVQLAVREKDIP